MSNPLTEWRREYLERRDLKLPTGLPLYSYRVTTEEFGDLEGLLKVSLERYLRFATMGEVALGWSARVGATTGIGVAIATYVANGVIRRRAGRWTS